MSDQIIEQAIADARANVSEQIYLLMDFGYISSDQQVYADTHLDEITKQYQTRANAWEAKNGRDIPLSMEMEIMHEEIRKVAEKALDVKEMDPLHETALYREAVAYFSVQVSGLNIINDHTSDHAAELIFCYENKKDPFDYYNWTKYEDLLGEKLTWDEFFVVDCLNGTDRCIPSPQDITASDTETIAAMKADLESYRNKPKSLADQIADAQGKADQSSGRQQYSPQPEPTL